MQKGYRIFLSYKRRDFYVKDEFGKLGTDPIWARRLGEELSDKGVSCWWDRWHIPEMEDDTYDPCLLMDILDDGIKQAVWFVGLMTAGYIKEPNSEKTVSWTLEEWRRAKEERGRRGRRQPLQRIAIFFQDPPAHPQERPSPTDPEDEIIWTGNNPSVESVVAKILGTMGVNSRVRLDRS